MYRTFFTTACAVLSVACATGSRAADTDSPPAAAPAFSVKNTFRNICGFCHENYGRKAGKGPQLMGTDKTDEQIFNRIKNGKPGRMAAFGGNFTDDQIRQIVAFIRNLKPDVDP
jgi:mono/diheme cytochrome c family protein